MNSTMSQTPIHHIDQVMASLSNKFLRIIAFLAVVFSVNSANCDRIVLKDGNVEESDRIWESKNYVHFILKGTQSVEIRYAKEIVDHIERDDGKKVERPNIDLPNSKQIKTKRYEEPSVQKHQEEQRPPALEQQPAVDPKIVEEHRKVSFYDPRRSKRYWASRSSRHDTLRGAIDALAKQYGRDSDWIMDHIGDDNNLGVIHQRLLNASKETPDGNVTGDRKIKTEKIKPPLTEHKASEPTYARSVPILNIPKGVAFYDPRRPRKYWADQDNRFDSLEDALNAMAQKYNVSVSWIEEHLGYSNDLATIHENLRKSLAP